MYLEETCVDYLNCKAFGGSRVKTRRSLLRKHSKTYLEAACVALLNCKAFGVSWVKTRRCNFGAFLLLLH